MSITAENIARLMELAGVDKATLADMSGVPRSTLSDIMTGTNRSSRLETLIPLAATLGALLNRHVSLDELAGVEMPLPVMPSLAWFWQGQFSAMSDEDLLRLRNDNAINRAAWCVHCLINRFTLEAVSVRLEYSVADLQSIAAGEVHMTDYLKTALQKRADVPKSFIDEGDPGPLDEALRIILGHDDAGTWLRIIVKAMKKPMSPEHISHVIDAPPQMSSRQNGTTPT